MKSEVKPPKLANKIFQWYCNRAAIDDLHGDVEELFYRDLERHSPGKAKVIYWRRIFSLIFSYAIRQRKKRSAYHAFSSSAFNLMMFKNYIKTASRSLVKHRFFTALNVFCLALGMSMTLIFIAMLSFIYTYDDFHSQGANIYRITTQVFDNEQNPHFASAPVGLVQKLKEDFSGVEKAIPIQASLHSDAVYADKKIDLDGYFTSSDFLTVFDFPLLKGNAASALNNPNSIVITEIEATKIFGAKDPMGEVIRIEPFGDFMVTGILKDLPKNSHMRFEALASYSTWLTHAGSAFTASETGWTEFINSYVYLRFPENTKPSEVEQYLNNIAKEKYKDTRRFTVSFQLQPLRKIVPGPDLSNEIGVSWSILGILMFASITTAILIPACANYVNLSISHSLNRMKEIGVRKVMGGQKSQIFFQFIMETTLIMLMALVLSYFIFDVIRGEFLEMTGRTHTLDLTPTIPTVIYFVLFALLIGFGAGAVPAIYFSKIKPVTALKGKSEGAKRNSRFSFRKFVITTQFVLSLACIMGMVIMLRQYQHSVNYDLGFQQQNLLDVKLQNVDPHIFSNEFGKLSTVQGLSMSSHILGLGHTSTRYIMMPDQLDSIDAASISIDANFISNMGLTLLAGKNFSDRAPENAHIIIANEELIKKLRISDPLAAIDGPVTLADGTEVYIGGVVKDFHYASLLVPIRSFFFEYKPDQFEYANIVLAPGTGFEDIDGMETAWKRIGGESTFHARFFSDELEDAYSFYLDFVKLFGFIGLLAITVACLGLLGTIVFIIRNRLKEVSIRKVMGASSDSLVLMLSKDFIILMLIASIVTVPTVYFLFQDVLLASIQHYNMEIGFTEIAISLIIMMVLSHVTILSQTMKAANTNPVDNLRSE